MLRLDFSSDGKWIRAESRSKEPVKNELKTILLSAESGDICADHKASNVLTFCAFTHNFRSIGSSKYVRFHTISALT